MTPIQASLKKIGGLAYNNLLDKGKKINPKFQANYLVRTTDSKETFSKGDTTNWFYELYEITEVVTDTIPSYHNDNLPERYNEALLRKAIKNEKNYKVMEKLNLS